MKKAVITSICALFATVIQLSAQQNSTEKKESVAAAPQAARMETTTSDSIITRREPQAQRWDSTRNQSVQGVPEQRRSAPGNKPK